MPSSPEERTAVPPRRLRQTILSRTRDGEQLADRIIDPILVARPLGNTLPHDRRQPMRRAASP
jgi:hypothetical protein